MFRFWAPTLVLARRDTVANATEDTVANATVSHRVLRFQQEPVGSGGTGVVALKSTHHLKGLITPPQRGHAPYAGGATLQGDPRLVR